MNQQTQREKADQFKALHERREAFVIPNPYDIVSSMHKLNSRFKYDGEIVGVDLVPEKFLLSK